MLFYCDRLERRQSLDRPRASTAVQSGSDRHRGRGREERDAERHAGRSAPPGMATTGQPAFPSTAAAPIGAMRGVGAVIASAVRAAVRLSARSRARSFDTPDLSDRLPRSRQEGAVTIWDAPGLASFRREVRHRRDAAGDPLSAKNIRAALNSVQIRKNVRRPTVQR